jgi:sugar phosphate isomerase/epimerase
MRLTRMGISTDSFPFGKTPKTALDFLEYCSKLGAGGVESALGSAGPDYIREVRRRVEEYGMYYEASVSLPGADTAAFERIVVAAKEAGATCLRSYCLGGRRYEVFNSMADWQAFAAESRARIARAVPIVEKHRIPLGLENHKDWTLAEMLPLLREYSSEYLGVCLDTGNNIALLDDNRELVESLAPYTVNTHLKDMAVAEYSEGFLLVEVPFGEGFLDLKWTVDTIARARPNTRFTLEMMTRSPLKIPCLTERYWTTFAELRGRSLARAIATVRAHPPSRPLPNVEALGAEARLQLQLDNVVKCIEYSRKKLGLAA